MTQYDDRGRRANPTFIDVLEHIGSGGITIDRSGPRRVRPGEEVRSYTGSPGPRRQSKQGDAHQRRRHKP